VTLIQAPIYELQLDFDIFMCNVQSKIEVRCAVIANDVATRLYIDEVNCGDTTGWTEMPLHTRLLWAKVTG